jgi:hypothetical protein
MAIHLDQQVRWLISFFFSNLTWSLLMHTNIKKGDRVYPW